MLHVLDSRFLQRCSWCLMFLAAAALGGREVRPGAPAQPSPVELAERVARLEAERAGSERQAAAERGQRTFARACATCHGRAGEGDGPAAADLDPPPRDLASGAFRFRSTASGEPPLPEDLERTIRNGLAGSSMPGFGPLLSDREIADLIAYIDSLWPEGMRQGPAPEPLELPEPRPVGATTVADGRAIYLLLECWRCHGLDGNGAGPSAATLTDEAGRPIRSTNFRTDPLKGGHDPQAVTRTLLTGLNGSPMPSYADALLFAREDVTGLDSLEGRIGQAERAAIDAFLGGAPDRAALDRLDAMARRRLRDERVLALAYYVLSLGRRDRFFERWFRRNPEREARAR